MSVNEVPQNNIDRPLYLTATMMVYDPETQKEVERTVTLEIVRYDDGPLSEGVWKRFYDMVGCVRRIMNILGHQQADATLLAYLISEQCEQDRRDLLERGKTDVVPRMKLVDENRDTVPVVPKNVCLMRTLN